MADYALALLELELAPAPSVVFAAPSIPVPTLPGATTTWNVWAADENGTEIFEYPTAVVQSIMWTLDAPTVCSYDVPIDATGLNHLKLANPAYARCAEVKIYRNGHLIFWGPNVTRRADSKARVWHYTAADPLWYLLHRNMGEATRHNYLGDSSFDVTFAGWSETGTTNSAIDHTRYLIGGGSLRMNGSGSGENFRRKTFTITAGQLGLALFLTAWVYVEAFTAPAFSRRAAFLGRVGATGPGAYGYSILDETTPLGTWIPMTTHVNMRPNTTETIDARLYRPDGQVRYDGVTVTIMESLSFVNGNSAGGSGWDQTLIAQMTARYLSGSLPVGDPYNKSNVKLATAGAASGIKKERTYQFTDHQPGYEGGTGNGALDEWCKADEGFDIRVDYDSPFVRTFRTYYPIVGQAWDAAKIQGSSPDAHDAFEHHRIVTGPDSTGSNWCITRWDYGETLEGSADDITETSNSGQGPGREEGGFFAGAALGGLTLELVEAAPTGAPLDLLQRVALRRGAVLARAIATPVFTMIEPKDPVTQEVLVTLIGELLPGDIIPIREEDGDVQLEGVYRVTQVTLDKNETLQVAIAV